MDHPVGVINQSSDVRDHTSDVKDHPVDVYPIVNDQGHVNHEEIVKLLRDEIGVRYASKSVSHDHNHLLFVSSSDKLT